MAVLFAATTVQSIALTVTVVKPLLASVGVVNVPPGIVTEAVRFVAVLGALKS